VPTLAVSTGGWFGFGILYLILLVTLGIISIRKGHWVMFIIGLFLPLFWLIGALLPARHPG
jgi:hypothetical protein